jgi:hypothetical protein
MAESIMQIETPAATPAQLRAALQSAALALGVAATHPVMPARQRSMVRDTWHRARQILGAPLTDRAPGLNDWAAMLGVAEGGTPRALAEATLTAAIREAQAAGLSRNDAAALLSRAWLDQGGGHGDD